MLFIKSLIGLAVTVALWSAAVSFFNVPPYILPGPWEVAQRVVFLTVHGNLAWHVYVTLSQIIWGFLLGAVTGIVFAIVAARVPLILRLTTPLILLLQTVPKIAIAPLLLLWLGLGAAPKVALVAIVTFFPLMTAMLSGITYINDAYKDLATILKLTPVQRFIHIELPASLPTLFAGATVASTLAMTAVVIGELMGTNKGIGFLLAAGQEDADTATVMAMVILLSFFGWAFYAALDFWRVRIDARFS